MYIEVSQDFKKKTKAAVFSIAIFVFVYILLFLFTIALALGCIAGGIAIIAAKPMFITLMLGAGLAGTGLFVFFFIIKFLFKKHINDRSDLTEIRRNDEPELFGMIDEIVKEAGTNAPKKVYLSYDVNASVFYDSSFWSMFLPIQKNLTIGMGLINTTTKQELKAILSHEFGHFSQRSMKVGSYVYNVNQIIFNLVNDDESYRNSVEKFANISGYFSIFAALAFFFTGKIKWILVKMYNFVNIRHMALSREMEFHADEVAANIAGSLALEESLLRLELANNSYQNVLSFYDNRFSKNESSKNIYREQFFVMSFLAGQNEVESKNGLPNIQLSESGLFNKSKLNIENQWASHPSQKERITKLRTLNIVKEQDNLSAKNIFRNFQQTEEQITSKLFSRVQYQKQKTDLEFEEFQSEFEKQYQKDSFDKIFNAYYDNKNPDFTVKENGLTSVISFDELFSKEKVEWVYTLIALESDLKTVEAISKKEYAIKTFDYDGRKYKQAEARILIPKIQKTIEEIKEKILQNDTDIYNYFILKAEDQQKKTDFIQLYKDFGEYDAEYDDQYKLYIDLMNATAFLNTKTPFEQIRKNFSDLKPLEEKLKYQITVFYQNETLIKEMNEEDIKDLRFYTEKEHLYFNNNEYMEHNLQLLMKAINYLPYFLHRKYFYKKKELLQLIKELEEQSFMAKIS
ncbi:M48 family metallopeptidase [Chryseobacterium sp. RG1]|uniref:M48 family metallopeptidase n=1 Tax=Chryseobacterium tagetis TaxID=2801334 RepID=A0ABS8A6Q3_9FLAO|nr:M48 family metallopeptidase [Chryseobacterium tagetis]MCA6069445.1 M48 family metallopeptidase [Chryseobacterium tagetis]